MGSEAGPRGKAWWLGICLGLTLMCLGCGGQDVRAAAAAGAAAAPIDWNGVLDLKTPLRDVRTANTARGEVFVFETPQGTLELTPGEFHARLSAAQEDQRRHGLWYTIFNITTPWGLLWVGLGFLGQALFTFRMVLQWYASEKQKRSVIPVAFWWGSLLGGMMLLTYFIWRKDIVGVVGQSTGVIVYARNLVLIHRAATPKLGSEARPA